MTQDEASDIYEKFITTLKDYQNEEITIEEVSGIVAEIMAPYPRLLDQFKIFLPELERGVSIFNANFTSKRAETRHRQHRARLKRLKSPPKKPVLRLPDRKKSRPQ